MSVLTTPRDTQRVYRFSVDQYHRMIEEGILDEGDGVELLRGLIVHKGRSITAPNAHYRFSTDQYLRMVETGILTEDTPVEFYLGEVVPKMPQGDPHGKALERLDRQFQRMLPDDISVRIQSPVYVPDGVPEPDLVLCDSLDIRGDLHPQGDEIHLVLEVAESSIGKDRGVKAGIYARAGIPVYWIVNVDDRQVEVYTDPHTPPTGDVGYRTRIDYKSGQDVPVVIDGKTFGSITVARLLPS
jgi:Uma2 family endonuclease